MFFAFVVGKGLRASVCRLRSAKKRWWEKPVERALPDRCERRKSFCGRRILEWGKRYVGEKRRTRKNHTRRKIDDKSETRNLRKRSHVRRIRKNGLLVSSHYSHRRNLPAADDPHPARVRARGDFTSRQAARHKRARIDFPHSDRRSHGENASSRRDHRRRAPGSHDTGQRADADDR